MPAYELAHDHTSLPRHLTPLARVLVALSVLLLKGYSLSLDRVLTAWLPYLFGFGLIPARLHGSPQGTHMSGVSTLDTEGAHATLCAPSNLQLKV